VTEEHQLKYMEEVKSAASCYTYISNYSVIYRVNLLLRLLSGTVIPTG
jgi:hypothetical protein